MGLPTLDDPLGERPQIGAIGDALEKVVDDRIIMHLKGRTSAQLDGVSDMVLVQELLARGWAVFRPNIAK